MQCVGRVEISLSCWLRQTGGNSRYLLRLELTIGLDAGRGSQGAGQLGKYKIEDTRFMTTKLFTKPLDDPNGSIKVNHNNAMQLASQTKKTPWFLRFAPGAMNLKEIAATTGIGTIYGLLFAGLLLMPFQSHRAIAAPPAEETVETQALPVLGIGAVFVIGFVAGYLATAAWDGTKWKAKQSKLPKGKVVADTILVVDESTGVYSSWYAGAKTASDESIPFVSYNKTKDYSWYDAQVVVVAYDVDEQKYKLNGEGWSWHGNGYIPSLLDMFNYRPPEEYNADTGEYEFTTSGFYIRIGTTANIDLTHAFDSDVDEANRDDALADEASSKKTNLEHSFGLAV